MLRSLIEDVYKRQNLHRLQKDQAKRVVDFLSGVIYAIEGDIQRIGPKIFLCTPRNISVAGTIDLEMCIRDSYMAILIIFYMLQIKMGFLNEINNKNGFLMYNVVHK